MTFDSITRALDYLFDQNPDKIAIIVPTRGEGGVVAYQLQFHDPDEVMIQAVPRKLVRTFHLSLIPDGERQPSWHWDLMITDGQVKPEAPTGDTIVVDLQAEALIYSSVKGKLECL